MHRRSVLALAGGTMAALAGCTTGDDGGGATGGATRTRSRSPSRTALPDSPAEETPDLDRREANVMAVAVDRQDGSTRLDVTLYHDDDGEAGYADWWQAERLDGSRLGRRRLAHPHGTRRFTRSATVEVPPAVGCLVVRGHDQTHGYGGRAMTVDLGSGATRTIRQGSTPRSVVAAECP